MDQQSLAWEYLYCLMNCETSDWWVSEIPDMILAFPVSERGFLAQGYLPIKAAEGIRNRICKAGKKDQGLLGR